MKVLHRYSWLVLLGVCGFIWQPAVQLERGVLDLRDVLYFVLVIGFWLAANRIVLERKKAE